MDLKKAFQVSHKREPVNIQQKESNEWAEVLDADAFDLFLQNGIFDRTTAQRFRTEILERGGTDHPMTLYKNFRGQEPSIKPLLKRSGMLK